MTVCILGNGLAALTLAKALVNMNINVELLAQNKNLSSSKTRTLGISKGNFNYFNKNIINIEKLVWKLKKIEIFTDNLKKEKILNFEDDIQLFSIIKNHELYKNLEKDLSKNIHFKKKISNTKNLSFVKKYGLIINCDYAHNFTKKYFSKKIEKKYNCFAYTTIIKHEKILNDRAIQIFTKNGPLAFLPISNTETSIVYSVNDTFDRKKDNIEEMIKINNFKYNIKEIKNIEKFELKSLNLRSYFHDNILAFGDLLHKIHPLAGQGFNMTIRDIKILTKIISDKIELGLPLDSLINDEFEKNVKHRNFIFSNGIDFVNKFFNIERRIKNNILSRSVQFFGNNRSIKKVFTEIADKGILF
jgi:2-octaprenyl-6-methoxyphenol hydroxylase